MKAKGDVLFVSGTLEVGGSESKIVRIANALAQVGYDVGIAYFNPPETLLEKVTTGVSVINLRRRGKYSFKSLRRVRALVVDNYRVIMSVNFYPLLYVIPAVKWLSRSPVRTIALVNTTDFVDRQWVQGHFYAPLLRQCDRLVYGCRAQQSLWVDKYRLPEGRSMHVYNGVDSNFYAPAHRDVSARFRAEFGIPERAMVVGSAGRFAPEKNFELLIESVARLKAAGRSAWLVIIGEGRARKKLEETVAMHGLSDRAIFPGVLNDVRSAFAAMDIFVLPSRAVETFSNAALEAMSMARPVLLSNIGGAAEMVGHGESGYLFESENADELNDLLIRLYDSTETRERIGCAARERILQHFRFEIMLKKYQALIDPGNEARLIR